jgi:hypothetical protein
VRAFLGFAAAAAAIAVALVLLMDDDDGKSPRAKGGAPAQGLEGEAVRGGKVDLERLRGHTVLVSFVNTRAEGGPSRAQVVFLRSMETQHARFGLRVIIVDAAEIAGAGRPSRNELINFTYDSHLGPAIAVFADDGSNARRFRVRRAPTTFLIDEDGVLRRRWNRFAGAADLDLAIRQLEGRTPTG